MLIPWRLDKYSYDCEQPTTYKVLLTNKRSMNARKFVHYGFHCPIFQRFPASRMWSLSTRRRRDCDWTTRLRQCSHAGDPGKWRTLRLTNYSLPPPVRLTLLSTVEAMATLSRNIWLKLVAPDNLISGLEILLSLTTEKLKNGSNRVGYGK